MKIRLTIRLFVLFLLNCAVCLCVQAQGTTAFTYQGVLQNGSQPTNGLFDLRFSIYSLSGGGSPLAVITNTATSVTNGLFTVPLDFGAVPFNGSARWLEVAVRTNGGGVFTPLSPRQQLTPAPYALYAPNAGTAALATDLPESTVTSAMIADGAVTGEKIAPLSVKTSSLDDGGRAVYADMAAKAASVQTEEVLPFEALLPADSHSGASLTFQLNGEPFGTVQGFVGQEALSEPYSFVVEVTAPLNSLNPASQLGHQGRILFVRNERSTAFSGIITGGSASSYEDMQGLYTFWIESPLALMALSSDYRVYQDAKVPDIAASNYLDTTGANLNRSLSGSYPTRTCVIQYGQSNADFFNRLLEENGISYFFNQETAPPVLTLVDFETEWPAAPYSAVPYFGNLTTNVPADTEFIRSFQLAKHQSTRRITLKTYDFTHPAINLTGSIDLTAGAGEKYEFGSALTEAGDLDETARARAERQTVERNISLVDGNAADLRPGYTFSLQDRSENGLDGSYLVTSVRHAAFRRVTNGVAKLFYGNQCEVIPSATPFRPAVKTPKPAVNCCSAVVVGPDGEEIYTDKYGRVKVQFHWDRYGSSDETSSAWLRVASLWAGSGWGAMFVPRIGQEVIVNFLNGDPDQPVVIGSLCNAAHMPPYALPAGKTRSGIKTQSTLGGDPDNYNELRFEDLKGSEEVLLHGEKDVNIEAENDFRITAENGMIISAAVGLSVVTPILSASGTLSASNFTGNGNGLTNLNAGNLSTGTIPSAQLAGTYSSALTLNNAGNSFTGSGGGLTSLNAGNLSSGTVPSARLAGTYSSALTLNNAANSFTGNGAGLTSLNAGALASGTVPLAQLPSAVVTNNESGVTLNALTLSGITQVSSNICLNDKDILFRVGNDPLHGMGWYGSGKLFAGFNVNGPVLYGNGGGALGTRDATTNIAFRWDNSGNVTITGSLNPSGPTVQLGTNIAMNDKELLFRGDANHGLGWYGTGKTFAGASPDGPVLYGYSGGGLGTLRSGSATNLALYWNNSGNVGIGTNSPNQKLVVAGNIYATGTITPNSDRNLKTDFSTVDVTAVLDKVIALPIQQWRFTAESENVKHVGPMAQDFQEAFGLGAIPTAIATVDADGVALAAIQGLNNKVETGIVSIQKLQAENTELKQRIERLEQLLIKTTKN